MDNVSSVKIYYDFIRLPKKKTFNIFAYAAEVKIIFSNHIFLDINDIAICDMISELSKWLLDEKKDFTYIPQDSTDEVLRFRVEDQSYNISSAWTKNKVKISKFLLDKYISEFVKEFRTKNKFLNHLL